MMTTRPIRVLGVTQPLSPTSLSRLQSTFHTVHYHPSSPLPPEVFPEIEALFLASAGADKLLQHPAIRECATVAAAALGGGRTQAGGANGTERDEGVERDITVSTASGIHVVSIPNWVVANLIGIYHQLPRMLQIAREQARWSTGTEVSSGGTYVARSTRGRTAGMLGYGSLGRETARLLQAHGMRIVAANTSGKATPQDGYILPGTGDPTGSIPSAYYSTRSPASFADFLGVCDVLVCTLPNTRDTAYLLDGERLALLPKDAVFINVGRGNLVRSVSLGMIGPADLCLLAMDCPARCLLPSRPSLLWPRLPRLPSTPSTFLTFLSAIFHRTLSLYRPSRSTSPHRTTITFSCPVPYPTSPPRRPPPLRPLPRHPPLLGAALDVTDPEPLPPSHPLWTHPKCIVTPHLSGDAEGEFELATDVLLHNLERIARGERPVNLVDVSRGY
ncbi:hypothetical protein EHS25_006905 [Saitozyma podzolica]|uniref:D-isomer specific 2-hydroxyacid dehydrogenase NAD-binding domain-containing protein n=1 Tax=Saitozyma podzolica TaxID=1890683 RepID=A0A427XRE2_9TREE|nr:hypothetical protein EHS25_006905 [Saitozyma podzolica]